MVVGDLVPNVDVSIWDNKGNLIARGVTDANGVVEFNLPAGWYGIVLYKAYFGKVDTSVTLVENVEMTVEMPRLYLTLLVKVIEK